MTPEQDSDLFWGVTISNSKGEGSLSIGKLPGRKSYALYSTRGTDTLPLAYFNGDDETRIAIAIMRTLVITHERREP